MFFAEKAPEIKTCAVPFALLLLQNFFLWQEHNIENNNNKLYLLIQ